jgi:hypothetical protein
VQQLLMCSIADEAPAAGDESMARSQITAVQIIFEVSEQKENKHADCELRKPLARRR